MLDKISISFQQKHPMVNTRLTLEASFLHCFLETRLGATLCTY